METKLSMYGFLKQGCIDSKAKKIYYFNNSINAGRLIELIERLAAYLKGIGLKKGEPVGICLPNIPQAAVALYAVNLAGGIANIIHPKIHSSGLKQILKDTNTKIIFLFDGTMTEYLAEIKDITVIACSASEFMKGLTKAVGNLRAVNVKGITNFSDVIKNTFPEVLDDNDFDAPAVYLHSSGTSGTPKTVVLSSYAVNSLVDGVMASISVGYDYNPHEKMLMVLPLFHGFGLGICIHLALRVFSAVLMPRFNARSAVKLIKKHEIGYLAGVPTMFEKLFSDELAVKGKYLASLRLIFCGADFLDRELKEKFDAILKANGSESEIYEGYGLSEITSVGTVNVRSAHKAGTQGRPVGNVKFKIVDTNGAECAPDTVGEVYIKCESMMKEYLNDVEETQKAVICDEEGGRWLRTGDLGKLDGEGFFTFVEREKRVIKIAGINIFPAEIERITKQLREVDEVCAVRMRADGKPHIKLYIVMNKNFRYSPLIKHRIEHIIMENCMKYAVPREIEVVESLNKNSMGKVDYKLYEEE